MKLLPKIIGTVILIILIVNAILQYNYIRIQRNNSLLMLSTKIQMTGELLSKINSGPIFYYDRDLIETNIRSFLKDPEITSIYVSDTSGEIDLFYENPSKSNKDIIKVETDVYFEGSKIGKIITTYTKDLINQSLMVTIRQIVVTLILSTVAISIILIFILRRIIKPIIDLTDLSSEISNGNLDKEIKIKSSDEIGTLSKSFIKMRDSIKEKIESLSIENEERKRVEVALIYKTEELAKANSELTAHRINLEILVRQRTSELQESLNNLEKTKDQLVQSEKMASLGDLVAGVAHEINTPIGIGVTASSHLENETKQFVILYKKGSMSKSLFENYMSLVEESSKMILSNMIKAASLIQSFKKVAVDQSSEEKRKFKLKEYVDEIFMSINSKFKHTNYNIEVICHKEIVMDSYPGAISQIITNLAMNALQHGFAEQNEGTITIEIKKAGDIAKINFSDSGIGISKEVQNKIFDPFFTTKRGQGGSGLGMHIVFNLINQTLNGKIRCVSKLGKGTTFLIEIPIDND